MAEKKDIIPTFSRQLSNENVQKLIQSQGTMILYQHLGSIKKRANEFAYLDLEARKEDEVKETGHPTIQYKILLSPQNGILINIPHSQERPKNYP